MTITKQAGMALVLTFFALLANVQAQTARLSTVNISSDGERVQVAAQGDVSEMRIDVASEDGEIVFESGTITGQQLDWNMKDVQGEHVAAGTYLVTVTFRAASGKMRKRVEQVTVDEPLEKSTAKAVAATAAPNAVQATITGAGAANKIPKFTGAATIGNSVITESAGKIGIGTAAPAQKLTVAGTIQVIGAGSGIKFPDNSIQTKAGLTAVAHNATLSGSGMSASQLSIAPLGVGTAQLANGAVTAGKIGTGQVVKSLNTLTDNVTLAAGENITITPAGNTLTIDSTGGGLSGVTHNATLTGEGTGASPLGVAVPLTLSGAGDFKSPSAARFDLFNTATGTGYSQHVTDKGIWQLATTGGLTRMLVDPLGNVGIGTNAPGSKLTVAGLIETTDGGVKFPDGTTQTTAAGSGSVGGGGTTGLIPLWTSDTDLGDSVITQSNGSIGIGTAAPEYKLHVKGGGGGGVYGETTGGALYNGVYGVARDSNAIGVRGDAFFAGAIGVHGFSQFHWGVFGYSNPSTGVRGLSGAGNGVEGITTSGNGVTGETHFGTAVAGVNGQSFADNGNGVIGQADSGGAAFGVWGKSTSGYAGYFSGNVNVNGNLSKNGGSFKIDHPLDPANKYLYHSFVESPDMMNIYNGNVTTDQSGEVVVTLPRYFQSLNRDFRYQLTVIGEFAQAIIASEIKGNRFTIKTDKPNVKVSWQVTGIRRDAWAETHRIPVEEEKPEREQGFYLHPELFNQPEERGIDWALRPEAMRRMKEKATEPPTPPQP